jgi:uncharacterized protein DUF4352
MKQTQLFFSILVVAAIACGSSTATPGASSTAAPIDTAAPGATAAPTATAVPPAVTVGVVGERVESNGIALTVNSVSAVESVNEFSKPKEGNVFLVVDVTIESVDKDPANYNPLYFRVKDADGFEYSYNFTAPDPTLKSGELSPGDKARGNVAFEVPADAKGLVLSYKAIDFSGDDAIEFDLGDAPAP